MILRVTRWFGPRCGASEFPKISPTLRNRLAQRGHLKSIRSNRQTKKLRNDKVMTDHEHLLFSQTNLDQSFVWLFSESVIIRLAETNEIVV